MTRTHSDRGNKAGNRIALSPLPTPLSPWERRWEPFKKNWAGGEEGEVAAGTRLSRSSWPETQGGERREGGLVKRKGARVPPAAIFSERLFRCSPEIGAKKGFCSSLGHFGPLVFREPHCFSPLQLNVVAKSTDRSESGVARAKRRGPFGTACEPTPLAEADWGSVEGVGRGEMGSLRRSRRGNGRRSPSTSTREAGSALSGQLSRHFGNISPPPGIWQLWAARQAAGAAPPPLFFFFLITAVDISFLLPFCLHLFSAPSLRLWVCKPAPFLVLVRLPPRSARLSALTPRLNFWRRGWREESQIKAAAQFGKDTAAL